MIYIIYINKYEKLRLYRELANGFVCLEPREKTMENGGRYLVRLFGTRSWKTL